MRLPFADLPFPLELGLPFLSPFFGQASSPRQWPSRPQSKQRVLALREATESPRLPFPALPLPLPLSPLPLGTSGGLKKPLAFATSLMWRLASRIPRCASATQA